MFRKPKRFINKVFIHCSASDNPHHDDVSIIKRWHLERGFNDVGYHYFIKKDGTLQVGRPLDKIPAAQRGYNTGSIAICLSGLNEDKFTSSQFKTLIALCREIDQEYEHNITFHGHNEVNSYKSCPVFNYRKVLNLDVKGYIVYSDKKKINILGVIIKWLKQL